MGRISKSPLEKYNEAVQTNISRLNAGEKQYIDPDERTGRYEKINGLDVYLSQDGLCSIAAIKEFAENEEQVVVDYKMLRENMYDVLIWPGYAVSINSLRYTKYQDRLDLLFIDLYKFFELTKGDVAITQEVARKVWDTCDLARAYLYPNTFYWLKSFGSFEIFIKQRKLTSFVTQQNGEPQKWVKESTGFTESYYKELINRTQKYRKKWNK